MPSINHHLDKKLRTRLRIYLVISVILFCLVLYNILIGDLNLPVSILAILIGVGIGILSARMFKISWNKDAQRVISRLDTFGIIIIGLYIIFGTIRTRVLEHFLPMPQVTALSFALASGLILGRFLGMRGKIIKVLKEQKVLDI